MKEFEVGECVWFARSSPRQVTTPCPVCFGKRAVTVILGDDTHVVVPCEYCGRGFEPPTGSVTEYLSTYQGEKRVITGRMIDETPQGRSVRYQIGAYMADTADLFRTAAECDARCAEHQEIAAKYEEDRARGKKKLAIGKHVWNAGYHLREAKKAREEADRHEARAVVEKERAEIPVEAKKETK